MKLERSQPEDQNECLDWLKLNLGENDLSPRTLKGCTFFKIRGILYLPIKPVLLLESLAPNPAVTGTKRLLALRRAMNELQKLHPGVELVFLTRSDVRLAETARSYGFEEAKGYVLFRLLDAPARRKEAQAAKKRLAEVRLRNNARARGANEAIPAGIVSRVRAGARRQPASSRPQQSDRAGARDSLQPLQPFARPRLRESCNAEKIGGVH
jgi:hypothetical protein